MDANLAKIHIAKKELGLSDEAYRDILKWKFNVSSSKELSPRQQTVLLNHFQAQGWRPKRPAKAGKAPFKRSRAPLGREALLAKIEAQLADRGLAWAYAEGMAKKICKVDALEFCDEIMLWKIVAAFSYDRKRRLRRA